MKASAVEVPVPSSTFLIAVRRADRAVHVQHDIPQPVLVMKPVDPLSVQIGQRLPVLGQGKRLRLEPPHLGSRSCLRVDSSAADNLTHDRIEGQPIGIVDILVSSQPPEHRLPEQAVKPVDRVLAPAIVAQHRSSQIRQPERVIHLAHHQKATVGTDLRAPELQPHARVEIDPIYPL